MSYRVRYTTRNGSTGHWAREYATRDEAQRAIDDGQDQYALAYVVEEVVATVAVPDATPDPTASNWPGQPVSTSTTERLVALMRERHARGLAKYGVTVDRTDLTPDQWAQHAIEELLDGAAYLMRLRDMLAEARARGAKP